jgi:hypothetical protein
VRIRKRSAIFLLAIFLFETVFPTVSLALTGGPASPEFSSFEPVATTNMVNEFSGDFTYNVPVVNIPGSDGGGYAMSLSYHSGESLESEASWVGYGWTLNPGAINRSKRGFADDTKAIHTFHNDVPKNWTASVGTSIGDPELFSIDIPVSLNAGLRYNNYKGFGYTAGIGLSVKGIVSIGYSVSDGSGSFSAQVNPAGLLALGKKKKQEKEKQKKYYDEKKAHEKHKEQPAVEKDAKEKKRDKQKANAAKVLGPLGGMASAYGMHTFGDLQMPTSITQYNGKSFNVSLNVDLDPGPVPIGLTMGLSGNYTQQTNEASKNRKCYGYLYSAGAQASSEEEAMMDYYTEKDSPFNKRDRYMSIPFSNADMYSVTGEGMSGGFRLHSKNVGLFRPNAVESKTQIFQAALEFNVGLTIGAGLDVGVGLQTLNYFGDRWGSGTGSANAFTQYKFGDIGNDKEAFFFRFSNDLGGDVDYGSDALVTAYVNNKTPDISPFTTGNVNSQPNGLASTIDNGNTTIARSGRSSYIAYNTYGEVRAIANGKRLNAYDNSASTNNFRPASGKAEQIAEIATVNEDGNTYVYGLAANSKNEKNLSYSMEGGIVAHRFQGYKSISGSNKMKVGTETATDYATTYLLTQITTPDYVDRTLNGPTDDDFGGFTRFVYKKIHTNYRWRMPFNGLSYSKGEQSNQDDDMGSFSSGTKEVYVLDSIITRTHKAKFHTSVRTDGVEAAADATAAGSSSAKGTNALHKLDSICVFTHNNGVIGKKIKKTCFKYNYSLCKGLPNSTGSAGSNGKLTLESVWFEHEGIVPAKISPYKFSYNYVNPLTAYPFPYSNPSNPNYFNEYANIISASPVSENPDYNICDIDAWGNYQKNGSTRFDLSKQHLNQNPSTTFDPAAWQLKRITLPSGGEIHVQYEQDDYQYVQNRRAMALVSLDSGTPPGDANASTFTLNVDGDLGAHTDAEKQQMVDLMNSEMANDKIYFKFLYTLIGDATPNLNTCNADYITGYVNFNTATLVGPTGSKKIQINVGGGSGGYDLPYSVCKDLVKKVKGGKISAGGSCDPADGITDDGSAIDIVTQLKNKMATIAAPGSLCEGINPVLSYFKVPLLKAKKGGGLRVKRVLMYDADGVDDGQPAVYGTEYIYKLENGESSGVASNEPATIREENPLINFLPKRNDQTFLNKAISGIDKEQFEGPLGESILPGPAVGYSRIVSKNIHDGKTNSGFIVSEFYTDKDFPFDMSYGDGVTPGFTGSGIANTTIDDQTFDKFWLSIPAVFVNISNNNVWSSQGYRFVKNNMNGQPKSVSTFGGDYLPGAPSLANKSSGTEYEYFLPGQKIPVMKDDGTTELKDIGKETEVVMEARGVEDITEDINTEFDASMGITPPVVYIPYFSGSGSLSYAESKMYTHVTSKVISFPAIQKSVTQTQDGISHKTEHLVFSRYTGKPIQTRSYDGFDAKNLQQSTAHKGYYTSFETPGYTQYAELGQKAINQSFKFSSGVDYTINYDPTLSTVNFVLASGGNPTALCNSLGALTIGDLISVTSGGTTYYFHVDGISGTAVKVVSSGHYNSGGTGSVLPNASMKIVKSGRTNQLNTKIANYTVYGDVSTYTVATANMATRASFVTNLNTMLTNAMTTPGTHTMLLNSSNIDFLNESGTCSHGVEQNYALGISSYTLAGPGRFTIRDYITTLMAGDVCTNQESYLVYPGQFILDPVTGSIKYIQDALPCVKYDVKCLQFCTPGGVGNAVRNVVASSAHSMSHDWPYSASLYDPQNLNTGKNNYETGAKGKWRMASEYAYKENIIGGAIENASVHERIYKSAGTYTMTTFNWKNTVLVDTTKWVRINTVTKYNPYGNSIEEKDASHFYSAAKYGYQQMLPYLISHNSNYSSAAFESFENTYTIPVVGNVLEENLPVTLANVTSSYAHSGKSSYMLGASSFTFAQSVLTNQMISSGVSCKVWVKDPQRTALPVKGNVNGSGFTFSKVAQTGEWTLYEAKITSWSVSAGTPISFVITNNITSTPTVYIDDLRMQPLDAQVNTYVYDKVTKRLVTSFNDQHFGLYYQYNQEGKLVRKLIETEQGMKTIAETQYNTPKVLR